MKLADKLKNIKFENDVSVFDHVNLIIRRMIENEEKFPLAKFEKYSESIRRELLRNES